MKKMNRYKKFLLVLPISFLLLSNSPAPLPYIDIIDNYRDVEVLSLLAFSDNNDSAFKYELTIKNTGDYVIDCYFTFFSLSYLDDEKNVKREEIYPLDYLSVVPDEKESFGFEISDNNLTFEEILDFEVYCATKFETFDSSNSSLSYIKEDNQYLYYFLIIKDLPANSKRPYILECSFSLDNLNYVVSDYFNDSDKSFVATTLKVKKNDKINANSKIKINSSRVYFDANNNSNSNLNFGLIIFSFFSAILIASFAVVGLFILLIYLLVRYIKKSKDKIKKG